MFTQDQVATKHPTCDSNLSCNLGANRENKIPTYLSHWINPTVPPVAQRERRIPFVLRNKVNSEIERLERENIIEDVTGERTPWLNPLVIVPKGDNKIRLCVDMRKQ